MQRITISVTVFLSCACSTAAHGDHVPVGEYLDYVAESGAHANPGGEAVVVYEHMVVVDDAAWVRLYFAHTILGDQSFVRMTSLHDGEMQELDAAGMAMWGDSSAYFNGNAVFVELIAAPATARNEIIFEQVAIERAPAIGLCGICDQDSRVPSGFDWACRLLPAGCSGSVWNKRSCIVTAGHCTVLGDVDLAQFRVPNSMNDCTIVHPPVADQFPIVSDTSGFEQIGKDWSVMSTGENSLDEKPYERCGARRLIASEPAEIDDTLLNVGYGVDVEQCHRSQTQQRHSGPLLDIVGPKLEINLDATHASSGSPLLKDDRTVGVFNACSWECLNSGTSTDYQPFVDGRKLECPSPGDFAPDDFAIPMGNPGPGNLTSLQDSDDDRLVIRQRAAVARTLPNIRLDIAGIAPFTIIRGFHFTVEARATARPVAVPQRILLFDFDTGGYEIVDERTATPDDRAVSIDITIDPSRFLSAAGDAMSRVEWFDPGATFFVNWGAEVDFIEWIVDP